MMFQNENYFLNIKEAPYDFANPQQSQAMLSPSIGGGSEQTIQIGTGDKSINADLFGFWIGAAKFLDAPFRVGVDGKTRARLYDHDGHLVLDDIGLESTHTFLTEEKIKDDDQDVTGTDWVDVVGLIHEIIDIERPTHILLSCTVSGIHDDAGERLEFRFFVNNEQAGTIFSVGDDVTIQTATGISSALLHPGVNEIKVQMRSSNANDGHVKGSVIPCSSHYVLLGR